MTLTAKRVSSNVNTYQRVQMLENDCKAHGQLWNGRKEKTRTPIPTVEISAGADPFSIQYTSPHHPNRALLSAETSHHMEDVSPTKFVPLIRRNTPPELVHRPVQVLD